MKLKKQAGSGQELVADFQAAFVSIATSEMAKHAAKGSEDNLMQELAYLSKGGYLQPGNIAADIQDDVSRASLDAHVKKIQAQQFDEMKEAQVADLSWNDQQLYEGRRVQIDVINAAQSPIDVVWFNTRLGYRTNILKKKRLVGVIEAVQLDKNMLILKPRRLHKLINSDLEMYIVYVIDPDTAEPMVSVTLN